MRNPGGYAIWSGGDGPVIEKDSITCVHCNSVVFVDAKTDPSSLGGFCTKCMKNICAKCADLGSCTPWEKQMEAQEKTITNRLLRDAALAKIL